MPHDFPLGNKIDNPSQCFFLPFNSRPEGIGVFGQNGFGKSSCVHRMVLQDRREGIASIVIDPKGDLADKLAADGDDHTILIDVNQDFPFGINPYEAIGEKTSRNLDRTVNNVVNLFKKVFGDTEFHPNIELVVRTSARMICCNDLTMAEVPYIFGSKAFRNTLMENVHNKQVEHFWALWDSLPVYERSRLVQPLIARLNAFLGQEWLYQVLSQRHTTVPFDKVFKEGYTLLIKLPREDEELTGFLGSVFVSLLSQYVWKQNEVPEALRPRIHIYIDEYSHFGSSSTTAMFFKEARFLNIGTLASLQILSDIKDVAHREALMNSGSLILFQVTGNDAEELVKNLTVPDQEPKIDPRVFAICREPYKYLLDHGHRNPDIQQMTDGWLRKLDETYTKTVKDIQYEPWEYKYKQKHVCTEIKDACVYTTDFSTYFSDKLGHLEEVAKEKLNDLLLKAMQQPETWMNSREYTEYIATIVKLIPGFIGVMNCCSGVYLLYQAVKNWLVEETPLAARELYDALCERIIDGNYPLFNSDNSDEREIAKRELPTYVNNRIERLNEFVSDMKAGCLALSQNPIYIPTGEINLEDLGKQIKSFADRKGELSHKLATLPRYTAYVQTHGISGVPQEGEVRLFAPPPPAADKTTMERVRERSRQYTRSWAQVEEEIEERQELIYATLQITPPAKKTPSEPDIHPWVSRSEIFYPQ